MKLIITDTMDEQLNINTNDKVITNNGKIRNCIGCFGCWIRTPGKCVITDGYEEMGKNLSRCSELILISKCSFGGLSPFVKNVLDRSISYVNPNFVIRKGEMHHKRRYQNKIILSVYFYGDDILPEEKETAKKLIAANCINFDAELSKVVFLNSPEELRGAQL